MDKQEQATKQYCMEELMRQMAIITPEYLQRVRMTLMIAFNLKHVEISCDINKMEIEIKISFKLFRPFLKSRKKAMRKIAQIMQDNFIQYDIIVVKI